jgi:hypothetical protein
MTPADIKEFVFELDQAIAGSTTGTISMKMDVRMAQAFRDFLEHLDPDMPSAPMCRALGSLVGDYVMNRKLERLDELADKLGVAALLLSGAAPRGAPG